MILRLITFLLINFSALGIGSFFTNPGVNTEWYQQLDKAPWTPPGWVFGFSWTFIMICLSIYMARAWGKIERKKMLLLLYGVQLTLNIIWNPIFFYFQNINLGLLVISALTILVGFILLVFRRKMKWESYLLLPYLIWLCIATSLNAYFLL